MDFKPRIRSIKILLLFFILVGCGFNQSKDQQAIQGSWCYLYDGFYFELHITENHFIYQSDIMGTEIKQYKLSNKEGEIKLYNDQNDLNPTTIELVLNTKDSYLKQGQYRFSLKEIKAKKIDLQKLLEADNSYYQDFLNSFNKRKELNNKH